MRIKSKLMNYCCALVVCLSPILAPYRLVGPISIGLSLIIFTACIIILHTRKIIIHIPLFFIIFIHGVLSFSAYFTTLERVGTEAILWSVIIIFTRAIAFTQLVAFFEIKSFSKVIFSVCAFCGGFLIYQLICLQLGSVPHNGQLFDNMTSGYGWSNSLDYLRPNSIFSEPSYFAIFLLPVLALAFINGKTTLGIICAFLLFLSTSTLGILGGTITLLYFTLLNKKYSHLIMVIISLLFVTVVYITVFDGEWLFRNNIDKLTNSFEDSSLRISGYIDYFWKLPPINSVIGVGSGQMSNFFSEYGISNYGNAFLIVLMNFGVAGLCSYLLFLRSLYSGATHDGKIFWMILFLICSVDAFIYSENFFYVLFYVLVFSEDSHLSIWLDMKRVHPRAARRSIPQMTHLSERI